MNPLFSVLNVKDVKKHLLSVMDSQWLAYPARPQILYPYFILSLTNPFWFISPFFHTSIEGSVYRANCVCTLYKFFFFNPVITLIREYCDFLFELTNSNLRVCNTKYCGPHSDHYPLSTVLFFFKIENINCIFKFMTSRCSRIKK